MPRWAGSPWDTTRLVMTTESEEVIVGVVSALLAATPLLALGVLVYLLREIAISAARINGWAEANFELDRLISGDLLEDDDGSGTVE